MTLYFNLLIHDYTVNIQLQLQIMPFLFNLSTIQVHDLWQTNI